MRSSPSLGVALTGPLVHLFGASDAVTDPAATYLRIAFLGTVPLLVMLAATGVLRGLQDTRTPLVVAVLGNALNIVLNLVLVYPVGLGIAGSALGSVLAQVASAAVFVAVVVRAARRNGASLRPDLPGIRAAGRAGVPLVVRTLTLRAAIVLTTYAVTFAAVDARDQEVDLATHQLAMTLWTFLAFTLDAIAIAAQALTGRLLGAGDVVGARETTRRMVRWGAVSGVVTGLLLAAVSPWVGHLFTGDDAVQRPAGAGAARRRARPAGRGRGLRPRRGADRGRRRPLPRSGRPGHPGRLRSRGAAAGGVLRRPGRDLGRLLLGLHGRPARGAGTPGPG